MDSLNQYVTIEETTESLISIIVYNKKKIELIHNLESHLEKAKNITNINKKTKINNRLFNLIKKFSDCDIEDDQIYPGTLFFVGDKTIEYKLSVNEIKTAREFNIPEFYISCENKFLIPYFYDIFYNFNFIYGIHCNKNEVTIKEFNKNKERIILKKNIGNEGVLFEELDELKISNKIIFIFGKSGIIEKIDFKNKNSLNRLVELNYSRKDLYEIYEIQEMKKNHILLEKKLNDLQNSKINTDLYLFGKLKIDFKEAIESYMLKELYIEENKLEKLKTFVEPELFNFTIIPIKVIEKGDIADSFIKNYNGLMGIKYYV